MSKDLQTFKKFGLSKEHKKTTKGGVRNHHFTFAHSSGVADWGEVDIRNAPMHHSRRRIMNLRSFFGR